MNRLDAVLSNLKSQKRMIVMAHMVMGYPNLENSEEIAQAILKYADILEVQIPFSDPIADGPVIAKANEVALDQGATVDAILKKMESIAKKSHKPIVAMTYFNIILNSDIERFCQICSKIGIQGLIVPDYPFDEEESNDLITACQKNQLAWVPVVAPTTTPTRLKEVLKHGNDFVYAMARTGTTGQKTTIDEKLRNYLKKIRAATTLPIAVGFGIQSKSQIEGLKGHADIAVIGSALIREYRDKPLEEGIKVISKFLSNLTPSDQRP